jgi:hypothetical protein
VAEVQELVGLTIPPLGPSEVLILMNRPDPDEGAILAP